MKREREIEIILGHLYDAGVWCDNAVIFALAKGLKQIRTEKWAEKRKRKKKGVT